MPKVILFNGPSRSGKDYATKVIMDVLAEENPAHIKLSAPLKLFVSDILGKPHDELEINKDAIIPEKGVSYRDLQIAVFNAIATVLGDGWLGQILVTRIKQRDASTIVVSDAGRNSDILPLLRAFGAGNILVLQIVRKGVNFDYDIRNYIDDPRVNKEVIYNDGTHKFDVEVTDAVLNFLVGGAT